MTHVITNLCLRDGGCVEVCPVECIVPGDPQDEWPLYYIDPDTCIDCGACVPECPWEAIFPEDEVPAEYEVTVPIMEVHGKQQPRRLNMPVGTAGYTDVYEGENSAGEIVHLEGTRILEEGETVDLTPGIDENLRYFEEGPGYP